MKILFYSTKTFEQPYLVNANKKGNVIEFTSTPLSIDSVNLAEGYEGISIFTGDDAAGPVIKKLSAIGVRFIAVRAAGYDNVDLAAAMHCDVQVSNVPAYSPYSIAEHAVALILALNRKVVLANSQVHTQNFTLDNLVGFDLHNKTAGVIGTGKTGTVFAHIMHGFGCKVLAYDIEKNDDLVSKYNVQYTDLETLCRQCDIISIHTPLNSDTKYLISSPVISGMKKGVVLVNTARGAIVNSNDLLTYLKNGHIGYYGMDVYEGEKGKFFFDRSGEDLKDDILDALMKMPNVLITPHQAFATKEALANIATTTFDNIDAWSAGTISGNELIKKKPIFA